MPSRADVGGPHIQHKEEMGEVLHVIDFDQLKIENQQYRELLALAKASWTLRRDSGASCYLCMSAQVGPCAEIVELAATCSCLHSAR